MCIFELDQRPLVMIALFSGETTAERIYRVVKELTEKEQKKILSDLKKKYLLQNAKEVDRSIKNNSITVDEVVQESRSSRRKIAKKYNAN